MSISNVFSRVNHMTLYFVYGTGTLSRQILLAIQTITQVHNALFGVFWWLAIAIIVQCLRLQKQSVLVNLFVKHARRMFAHNSESAATFCIAKSRFVDVLYRKHLEVCHGKSYKSRQYIIYMYVGILFNIFRPRIYRYIYK